MFLVCTLLFGVSLVANAENDEYLTDYNIYQTLYYTGSNISTTYIGQYMFNPNDGTQQQITSGFSYDSYRHSGNVIYYNYIGMNDNSKMISKGDKVRVLIENASFRVEVLSMNEDKLVVSTIPDYGGATVFYTDGTSDYFGVNMISKNNGCVDIEIEFTAKKDVEKIMYETQFIYYDKTVGLPAMVTVYMGEVNKDTYNKIAVSIEDINTGLLSGILGKLQEVKDNISNVITSITELPQKIWAFIENGLKSLFVPDEQYIVEYKDKWDTLLENKLGAVYEVANVTFESWDRVRASDEQDTIQMPEVSIPLPDDNEFTFGGYDVKIVPDGFGFLVTSVKIITAVVCTIAFVNGLRKRYDEVMGVEQ